MSVDFPLEEYPFKISLEGTYVFFKEATGIKEKTYSYDVGESDRKYYDYLVLKDGFLPEGSPFYNWIMHMICEGGSFRVPLKDLQVEQLDTEGNVVKSWTIYNASPMIWLVGEYVNEDGNLVADSLSFHYTGFDENK